MVNVFVYGTLINEEVVKILLKHDVKTKPATLRGHTRYSIKG